jgi:hypothetical protein
LHGCDRRAWRRGKIDRDEHAPELDIAAHLVDEAARTRREEQRRDGRAAEHRFRHRALEPMLHAVAAMGREHHEVARVLVQEVDDRARGLLQGKADVVDLDPEPGCDHPGRIVRLRESPLHQQAPGVRKRQRFVGVVL